jgi:hypothetical protein
MLVNEFTHFVHAITVSNLLPSANSLEKEAIAIFRKRGTNVLVEIVTDVPDRNLNPELVDALSISLLDFILASGNDALRTLPRLVEVELIDMILKDLTARQRHFA